MSTRAAAACALALAAGAVVLGALATVESFPSGLLALLCVVLALACGWFGVVRRGVERALGLAGAVVLVTGAIVLLVAREPLVTVVVAAAVWLALAAARVAFLTQLDLPRAPAPRRAVMFYNPRSGGGTALRLDLPREARERGIEPIELSPGAQLEDLVRDAVAAGADALAMAGGDGSQAVVAAVAAEHDLPYTCIPAGTRNHFALDLGVNRRDPVGALDAFVSGGERVVDLAEVNGRVFVNNVSLGLYAEALQRPAYREAKLRTLLEVMPDAVGPGGEGLRLRWDGALGGGEGSGLAAAILVSNNPYRLGRAVGSGTRPRLDAGRLGIVVFDAPRREGGGAPPHPWRTWTAPAFEVDGDGTIAAGIDGEAASLEPPLRFRIRPAALRVRISLAHPGASPSAMQPQGLWEGVRTLAALAVGHDPRRTASEAEAAPAPPRLERRP